MNPERKLKGGRFEQTLQHIAATEEGQVTICYVRLQVGPRDEQPPLRIVLDEPVRSFFGGDCNGVPRLDAHLKSFELAARDYSSLHLVAWTDTDNNVRFTYSYGGGTRNVGITSENNQVMDSYGDTRDLGSAPFKMRLVRAGNLYTGYISTHGEDFVAVVTNSVSLVSPPAKIGFWLGIDPS